MYSKKFIKIPLSDLDNVRKFTNQMLAKVDPSLTTRIFWLGPRPQPTYSVRPARTMKRYATSAKIAIYRKNSRINSYTGKKDHWLSLVGYV